MEMKVVLQKGDLPRSADHAHQNWSHLATEGRRAAVATEAVELHWTQSNRNLLSFWNPEMGAKAKKGKRAEMASIRQAQVLLRRREE